MVGSLPPGRTQENLGIVKSPCFTPGGQETQRGEGTGSESRGKFGPEVGLEPRALLGHTVSSESHLTHQLRVEEAAKASPGSEGHESCAPTS